MCSCVWSCPDILLFFLLIYLYILQLVPYFFFFFFTDTATTEIYTLSLHDALPILLDARQPEGHLRGRVDWPYRTQRYRRRSEEHTSELQSRVDLVCRLLLEKKKITKNTQ